jgi:hypothetical protein
MIFDLQVIPLRIDRGMGGTEGRISPVTGLEEEI